MEESYLFAFDFDDTVTSTDSDRYVKNLVKTPVPEELEKFYDGTNWTEYMNKVFEFLHQNGVFVNHIIEGIRHLEPTIGMAQLLIYLVQLKNGLVGSKGSKISLLIISDANDLFITEFLKCRVLEPLNANNNEFDVITNRSYRNGSTLSISAYEYQTSCKLCPKNLCKGSSLSDYINAKGPFTKVFYTGDGANDICPSLRLTTDDYVFVRKNYAMYKRVQRSSNALGISANMVFWDSGETIQSTIIKQL